MSTHLSPPPQPDRPDSRVSLALSDATYHSFQDIELSEPKVSERPKPSTSMSTPVPAPSSKDYDLPSPPGMRRHDSGYESLDRRDSQSQRRSSTVSVTSSTKRRRTRPSTQRSSRSGPVSYLPRNSRVSISPHRSCRSRQSPSQQPLTFFHFPHFTTSEPALDETASDGHPCERGHVSMSSFPTRSDTPTYPPPPQTTHYWTSDRTRRLEYAAIDAASRGVRGWVMRYVVPDCFVPKSKRRVVFEDDRGSVVRYRLELDEGEEGAEKRDRKRRKGWWFSVSRH